MSKESRRRALGALLFVFAAVGVRGQTPAPPVRTCDVLIVGGSFGGCAAAHVLRGRDVIVVEDCEWIGGQVTSQGTSALDEHKWIESFGASRSYAKFRESVRSRYGGTKNPGGSWVSRLSFEPRVGLAVLEEMTAGVEIIRGSLVDASTEKNVVTRVGVRSADGKRLDIRPRIVLEATDLGDFWAAAGIEFRIGTESKAETGEPHAADAADPRRLQSYTFPFAVDFRPGEKHLVEKPEGYERMRDSQPFTLSLPNPNGGVRNYGFFKKNPGAFGPFFTYRRLTPEIAMINWPGNDYRGSPITDGKWDDAKRLSLAFLYWLQTECPRDDGGKGYPELRLRKDVMGTGDGLSMRPYVREGRRLVARTTIKEGDLLQKTARARLFRDSVGVGSYGIDLHACAGDREDRGGAWIDTKPFQIPFSALVPKSCTNAIAAGKAIGTTHVTNGAYRLHPVEWAIGEAAAHAAALALDANVAPSRISDDPLLLDRLQERLVGAGVPIFWFVDLPTSDPLFEATQLGAVRGQVAFDPDRLELTLDAARRAELESAASRPK